MRWISTTKFSVVETVEEKQAERVEVGEIEGVDQGLLREAIEVGKICDHSGCLINRNP